MLDRIEFGTTGWLKDQSHICWYHQILGTVPSCSIVLHDEKIVGKGVADMLQEQIHHGGVGSGKNERGHLSCFRCHHRIDIGVLTDQLTRGSRSDSRWGPGPSGNAHSSKA